MEPGFLFAAPRRHWSVAILAALVCLPAGGCRLCADGDQHAYPAYGGAWQRTRRDGGRVGSVFAPAGAKAPQLVDRDRPPEIDSLQRRDRAEDQPPSADDAPDGAEPGAPGEEEAAPQQREDSLEDLRLQDIRYQPPAPAPAGLH